VRKFCFFFVFVLPLYHFHRGLSAKLCIFFNRSRPVDHGPLDGSVPSVCRPYQRQSKSKAKCTRGARPCLFLLSLICQVCRRTLYLQTHRLAGVARRGVRRATRSAMGLQLRAIIMQVLHTLQDVMHVFTAQLAFSFCGLLGFVHIVLGQHGHRLQ
jgi:hypothetical protein